MSWLDNAIEQASKPIKVDVKDLGLDIEFLEIIPLSAAEFQTLKADPEVARLTGEDRNEHLGLRAVFEMVAKCDSSVTWGKWRKLPLQTLGEIATRVTNAVGSPAGGGVLGE
tara:strand:- start:305 stop:640 length:336 start_codon:yes stop_codon:yes gene_type:complete